MFKAAHGLGHASINIIVICNARTRRMLLGCMSLIAGLHAIEAPFLPHQSKPKALGFVLRVQGK